MKNAHVKMQNPAHNFTSSINGTDDEIRDHYVGKWLNLGTEEDNMQLCVGVEFDPHASACPHCGEICTNGSAICEHCKMNRLRQ